MSRLERFRRVGSTQDVVRAWLEAGEAQVCVAVADEQTAGRGRLGRPWRAPPGRALLVSAGFRPHALATRHAWRLPAIVALAMLDAVEAVHPDRSEGIGLKWPNDLVSRGDGRLRKLGGVLGEGRSGGDLVETAIVGIGIDGDWPASEFPAGLAASMTSLREATGGPVDHAALLEAWLARLAVRYRALDAGRFPVAEWAARQVTTGALVEVDLGSERLTGPALGVDGDGGGLIVRTGDGSVRTLMHGDVVRCRVEGMGPPP